MRFSGRCREHVTQIVKYLPYKEILDMIERKITELEKEKEEVAPVRKPDTKVIAVYSPVEAAGKVWWQPLCAGRCRGWIYRRSWWAAILCRASLSIWTKRSTPRNPWRRNCGIRGRDTYWNILQNIKREELACLLPFEKALPALGVGAREMKNLISILKENKDFDAVILDIGQ